VTLGVAADMDDARAYDEELVHRFALRDDLLARRDMAEGPELLHRVELGIRESFEEGYITKKLSGHRKGSAIESQAVGRG